MPACRAKASSTPLTNFALAEVPKRSASLTASWIATRGGVSPFINSAAPSRRTDLSIAPRRSRRQFVVTSASRESSSSPLLTTSRTSSPAILRSSGATARSSQTWVATRSGFFPPRMSHAYSAWRARARARDSIRIVGIEPVAEIHHLERCQRGIVAFVAVRTARTVFRLLVGVAGQNAETDRRLGVGAHRGESARRLAGDVVEVRGLTTDHGADGDQAVVALAGEQPPRRHWQLPRARHPDDVDVFEDDTGFHQRVERAIYQLLDDRLVEATREHGHAATDAARQSLKLGHLRGEEVSQLRPLGFEVARVLVVRDRDDGDALVDGEAVTLQTDELARIVGDGPDGFETEIEKDLRADSVIAEIGLEAEALVRLDGVDSLILELVRLQLVEQPDPAAFLIEVDDDALPFFRDHLHRGVELPSTVAAQRVE